MQRIDAHLHYAGDHTDDRALLEQLGLKLFNISVATPDEAKWRARTDRWKTLAAQDPAHYAWCAGFDLPRCDDPNYFDTVLTGLAQDFDSGAVGCKIWKNIGMEVKKPDGSFMMVDDPYFDPVYDFLEKRDISLLLHIGEPLACWQPLEDPQNPHYNYYSQNPQWHMHGRQDFPSHAQIIAARDRLVAKRPGLRIIGAHLASLEYDVAEIAKRLDQFPNFAVDTSARQLDLACQDSAIVRQFIETYRDRILYGSDMVYNEFSSTLTASERQERLTAVEARWQMEFAYYESKDMVDVRGRAVQGLGLANDVLEDLYLRNAQRWYPGL
ncbi:MAG TPA: hypothetical protein EYG11_05970 [Candidatus Latescibacteria bacterium]|nr:hypothetical protein [Candidatus Handelsmanbacteria bacterium]HIL08230.1 hypothetical protein [Candidatus Latescibacterota bacterium]